VGPNRWVEKVGLVISSRHQHPLYATCRLRLSADGVWVLVPLRRQGAHQAPTQTGTHRRLSNDEETQTIFLCLLSLPLLGYQSVTAHQAFRNWKPNWQRCRPPRQLCVWQHLCCNLWWHWKTFWDFAFSHVNQQFLCL